MDSRTIGASQAYTLPDKRFALLIDADNVSAKYLKPILDELSKYGTVTYKRIYGDWTLSLHAKWKSALLENSITPIQQFGYTQGKNATDSAMIIDAMDILYTNSVEGFCIVSSDSDFTRLAARLRESGVTVIGMGEKKTPVPFRTACDVFVTLELLTGAARRRGKASSADAADADVAEPTASKQEIEQAVVDIITDNTNNGKATGLGEIGSRLQKRYPDFDVRSYGTNLLSKLLSDFSSVRIAKAGSNVNVELADGAPGGHTDDDGASEAEQPEAVADVATQADEDGEARRGRRRRRRGRGGRGQHADVEGSADDEGASAQMDDAAFAEGDGDEAAQASERQAVEADPEADQAAKPRRTPRSRRTRRARSGAAVSEHDGEGTAQAAAAAPDVEKPSADEKADRGLDAAPADEGADLDEVRDYLMEVVRDHGKQGVAVGELGKLVRRKFKDFRVTKTGYRNLRLYVASFEGVVIEKREDDRYVTIA